ncbi:aldehyde dehydrogenase domain-containing protein [Microdochium trichocladiopsis]|uniref:aldehyde dehydrogenase (NAD(+)) n=1 Tax=Microdochium trichocladiopsis TaxID=1682393 RepID=A0A9P8YFJ4_9PEZI|nr:aldehyde dehydrogenase domain-containing protein [Microdochium trichocladiopsis]KAH7039576.1 aldehyde dehydrogenase domain-containing protein [Microdochium trichocladiopsis]
MASSVTLQGAEGRQITVQTGLFIDNEFVPATNNATLDVENPNTATIIAQVSAAQAEDVDRAVRSSQRAFATWKHSDPSTRRALLLKLADLVEAHGPDLASLEAIEGGLLYRDSLGLHVAQSVDNLRYFAGWADKLDGASLPIPSGVAYTRREPIGVCAAVVPWNSLMILFWKLAPAIAAGNTIVIKTAELTPLWAQKSAELIKEAGFPRGVINIICGLGSEAGQALADHPAVRKIAFTGSTATGRRIMQSAARSNLKKVSLELGGKGPSIVFADADWENALFWTTLGITASNGQICAAGSRIYVQDTIYHKFVEEFSRRSRDAVHGDPLLAETTKGPVASEAQLDKILSYVERAKQSKARLLHGGEALPGKGHFMANTAFADVDQNDAIMRDEIFGPFASIAPFSTEDEVIRKANDSDLGLNSAVFTNDVSRAFRLSEAIETGTVTVNCWAMLNANTPFGGVKESGFGRDSGQEALDNWTVTKTVKFNILPPKL